MNDVSRETISEYVDLVLKWNRAHNLISRKDENNIWDRHVLNSLAIEKYIDNGSVVVDLGSGAGFPGVLLSIVKNNLDLYLVDSNIKKTTFLNEVKRKLGLNYHVINGRVENLNLKDIDYITARGFSSIYNILEFSQNIVSRETKFVLLKGDSLDKEIKEAKEKFNFDFEVFDEDQTKIIIIKNVLKIGI